MHWKTIGVRFTGLLCVVAILAIGASAEKTNVKGIITNRNGDTLIVKSGQESTTVVLTDSTTTKDNKGILGVRKQFMANVVLIPGLKVNVYGSRDAQGRVVARTIVVDGDDLEAAQMIESGLHPTAEQVETNTQAVAAHQAEIGSHRVQLAMQKQTIETHEQNIAAGRQQLQQNMRNIEENTQRFMALSDYDVKNQATVKFNFNSAALAPKDKQQLQALAQNATKLTGYIVEVIGYADSTGTAAVNTKLSEDRAKAVVTYLFQQCRVPMRHIVAPGAMGEYAPAASNETKTGRAENRRVEVKVLVNKGIAGS